MAASRASSKFLALLYAGAVGARRQSRDIHAAAEPVVDAYIAAARSTPASQRAVAFDIGANNGGWTQSLHERLRAADPPGVRRELDIVMLEPQPQWMKKLKARAERLYPSVTFLPAAAWWKNTTLPFFVSQASASSSLLPVMAARARLSGVRNVTAIDIAGLIRRRVRETDSLVFCKLDVEGAEYSLLPHLLLTGSLCHCRYLLIEWHLAALPEDRRLDGLSLRLSLQSILRDGCHEAPVVMDDSIFDGHDGDGRWSGKLDRRNASLSINNDVSIPGLSELASKFAGQVNSSITQRWSHLHQRIQKRVSSLHVVPVSRIEGRRLSRTSPARRPPLLRTLRHFDGNPQQPPPRHSQNTHCSVLMKPPRADLTPTRSRSRPPDVRDDLAHVIETPPEDFHLERSRLFAPRRASPDDDGWYFALRASQSPRDCSTARYLLIEDDLDKWGLGATANVLSVALAFAAGDRRVLLEKPVDPLWSHNLTNLATPAARTSALGIGRPRWCDRPPYTLQCLFRPWSHCMPPHSALARAIRPDWRPGTQWMTSLTKYYTLTRDAQVAIIKASWLSSAHHFHRKPPVFTMSVHTWGTYRVLFRPRRWIARLGDCLMARAELSGRDFIDVHIRDSVEKRTEIRSGHMRGGSVRTEYFNELAEALSQRLGSHAVFVQTASPSALRIFSDKAQQAGLAPHFSDNARSEHDSWGGWQVGSEMVGATVGVVNAYVAAHAVGTVSPTSSAWTRFLETFVAARDDDARVEPRHAFSFCCLCSGSANMKLITTKSQMSKYGLNVSTALCFQGYRCGRRHCRPVADAF